MEMTIDRYTELVAPVSLEGLDLDEGFADHRLEEDVLRCIRDMHDIEMHTVCYLRDLLVTSAHRDPEITTFVTFWSYEEYWHGAALAKVLAAHDEVAGAPRIRELRRSRRAAEALKPLAHGVGSAAFGPSMTAVHMTWGPSTSGRRRLATRSSPSVRTIRCCRSCWHGSCARKAGTSTSTLGRHGVGWQRARRHGG